MRYLSILLLWSSLSLNIFAHQNTTYPLLVNDKLHGDDSALYSVVVDADINKTGFRFVILTKEKIDPYRYSFFASASLPKETKYSQTANFNQAESTDLKYTYDLTLPLPKTGTYSVDFTVFEQGKTIKQHTIPVEIIPEGPSKNEGFLYAIPFILVAFIGIKIFIHKKRKIA